MPGKVYFRIDGERLQPSLRQLQNSFRSKVVSVLSNLLPKANPDFEHLLGAVEVWEIEFDDNQASREIGLDKFRNPIVAMPFKGNYGFWVDSALTVEDLQYFGPVEISAAEFEQDWESFMEEKV